MGCCPPTRLSFFHQPLALHPALPQHRGLCHLQPQVRAGVMDGKQLSTAVKPQLGCVRVSVAFIVGPMCQAWDAIVPHPWELCKLC